METSLWYIKRLKMTRCEYYAANFKSKNKFESTYCPVSFLSYVPTKMAVRLAFYIVEVDLVKIVNVRASL